jgi:hypothetical protein
MNPSLYQIFLAIIATLFILNGIWKFFRKENHQTFFKFAATFTIWGSIFTFAIFPNIGRILSTKLGLGENLNTLIFTGFVIIFVILFKLLSIIERIERNISEIVRKEALDKLNKN